MCIAKHYYNCWSVTVSLLLAYMTAVSESLAVKTVADDELFHIILCFCFFSILLFAFVPNTAICISYCNIVLLMLARQIAAASCQYS